MVNIYIAYEINLWTFTADKDFALGNSLFGAVKLTKITTNFDKYEFSGYGIGFDAPASFSLTNGSEFGKNVIIFGAAMSSSLHIDNRRKDILVLGKGPAQGLGVCSIHSLQKLNTLLILVNKKNYLSLHYNGLNS